jgi:uncharacterized cupredoxin-like copper-binding protein
MRTILTWRRALLLLSALLLLVAMLALACGGDDDGGEEGDDTAEVTGTGEAELFEDQDGPVVNVDLGEFFVTPEVGEIEAGSVTFNASNVGAIPHELAIIKTDTPADELPVADAKVDEGAAGEEIGRIAEFDAGLTVAGTFELDAGTYALICNIPGHYDGGMFVEFTVE